MKRRDPSSDEGDGERAGSAARGRRRRLADRLRERELDALLVTRPVDVTYLTGLVSSNAACLVTASGAAALATDDRYVEAAQALADDLAVRTARDVVVALVDDAEGRVRRLGLDENHVTLAQGGRIRAALRPGTDLEHAGDLVPSLRAHKDPAEVEAVAEACAVSVGALTGLLGGPIAGRSEREIARDLEARMLATGADGLAFDTIVAAGPNGAVPHHRPSDRLVSPGDLLTIDFGATVRGYHADCTRTVVVGTGTPAGWQSEIHDVVREAQAAGVAALHPGRATREVDEVARGVVEEAGYGDFFVHGLGHGVGLEIHEAPWLTSSRSLAGRLPSRTTVTVEPGVYLPGRGGVRIEDTVDVGPDGVRVLTDLPTDLLVVDE